MSRAMSGEGGFAASDAVDLLEWKHTIFDLYAGVRASASPQTAWFTWRGTRDRLYRGHPQSPIPEAQRAGFGGSAFYDYDPAWRTTAVIEDAEPAHRDVDVSTGGVFSFTRIGVARFTLGGTQHSLELAWNDGYGGGVFLAFADDTTGDTTYGGGRYLIDTVKGADLGFDRAAGTAVLDFNFAFNPSCSCDPRWTCPLAPATNRLALAVTAGEQHRAPHVNGSATVAEHGEA